jgi:hypothetical protein
MREAAKERREAAVVVAIFVTKASVPPPFAACSGLAGAVGKSVEAVEPVR